MISKFREIRKTRFPKIKNMADFFFHSELLPFKPILMRRYLEVFNEIVLEKLSLLANLAHKLV